MEGNERHEAFDYPDDQMFYFQMADRFGWTPDQVDNLPAGTADWLIAIAKTVEDVKADKSRGE